MCLSTYWQGKSANKHAKTSAVIVELTIIIFAKWNIHLSLGMVKAFSWLLAKIAALFPEPQWSLLTNEPFMTMA